jgi:hypothetical protein
MIDITITDYIPQPFQRQVQVPPDFGLHANTRSYLVINAQRLEKVKFGQAPGALQGTDLDS